MSKLFFDALTDVERNTFPRLKHFSKIGVLVGGTALTLQIRHRRSYDFDIFLKESLPQTLLSKVKKVFGTITILKRSEEELTFTTSPDLKITFFYYPFKPLYPLVRTGAIPIASWKDIAADKAYTIGRRALYRDYVDLFFLIKEKRISIDWISRNAKRKFGDLFPEKIFLGQLTYLKDLRMQPIEFLGDTYTPEQIESYLSRETRKYVKRKI